MAVTNTVDAFLAIFFKFIMEHNTTVNLEASDKDAVDASLVALLLEKEPAYIYEAQLSQAGTAAPTAAVLKNSLPGGSGLAISRNGVGDYNIVLANAFVNNKTFLIINSNLQPATGQFRITRTDANTINIKTYNGANALTDALMTDTSIRISVFK
jgi:hypothetical protein